MNNNDNKDWSLVGKYLSGEANSSEKQKIEIKMTESDEFRKDLEKNSRMLNKITLYYQSEKFNSLNSWEKIKPVIQAGDKVPNRKKEKVTLIPGLKKYAAVAIILLAFGFVAYYSITRHQAIYGSSKTITTENQVLKDYILPDGSTVTLNSKTTLKHPQNFKPDIREVFITGEAFFDVVPNPEKPFVINVGNARVKVLGTSFNVCAYPEDEMIEVLVETGSVKVTGNNPNSSQRKPEIILNAGEKGTLFTDENTIEKTVNNDKNLLAWKTGILVFRETPLPEVIKYLQKVYHIKIDVKQNELNDLVLTARFDEKPIDFVLEVIRLTFNLDLYKDNEEFVLFKQYEPEKL